MEKNVMFFDNEDKYHSFVVQQTKEELGEGAEGIVYLTKNNETIKELFAGKDRYPNDNIIMASDVQLDSFLFPKELYVCNKTIIGYKADFFYNILRIFDGNINDIDLDAYVKAGYKLMEDIIVLSKMNYILYDLPYNLLFDGKTLKAIDTLGYYKNTKSPSETLHKNIVLLKKALIYALTIHDGFASDKEVKNYTRVLNKSFKE